MLILRIWKYLSGYSLIKVSGRYLEKYINILAGNNIQIWDIKKISLEKMTFKILSKDEKIAKKIAERTNYSLNILTRYGAQRYISKIKKKKIFVFGSLLCFFFIFAFSFFIWDINIYGSDTIDTNEILNALHKNGLYPSSYKYALDLEKIENEMLNTFDSISYIDIQLKGSNAMVQIVEKNTPLQKYDKSESVHIVAKEDATIYSILPYSGISQVEKGDSVKKGEILISGAIEYELHGNKKFYYVHSMGEVLTLREYLYEDIIINPYIIDNNDKYTKENKYFLFGKDITLNSKEDDEKYVPVEMEVTNIKLGFLTLPIKFQQTKWYNIEDKELKSNETIENEVITYLVDNKNIDKNSIVSIYLDIQNNHDNNLIINATVSLKENIGIEQKITDNEKIQSEKE